MRRNLQIGSSNKARLLHEISKQLDRLMKLLYHAHLSPVTTTTTTTAVPGTTTTTTTALATTTTTTTALLYEFIMEYDDVANVPVADGTSLSDWNTFFDLPTYGPAFTSLVFDDPYFKLYGPGGVTMKDFLFDSNVNIVNLWDTGCFDELAEACFYNTTSMSSVSFDKVITMGVDAFNLSTAITLTFPKLVTAGLSAMAYTQCTTYSFPKLEDIGAFCFKDCNLGETFSFLGCLTIRQHAFEACVAATFFHLGKCTDLGGSVGSDNVFKNISGNTIDLYIPAALMTCNSGNPDGDITNLQGTNSVIVYTT